MDATATLLVELRADPRFLLLVQKLKQARPQIPEWQPGANAEDWMHQSSLRRGFDLAVSFLGLFEGE
jgi:hypothetical protein